MTPRFRRAQVTGFAAKGRKTAGSLILSLLMLGVLLSVGAGRVSAACPTSGLNPINWTDGFGNWSSTTLWSIAGCSPDNNNNGTDTFAVTINTPGANVTLDVNATVDSLTLGSGASLNISAGKTLNLANQPHGITDVMSGSTLTVAGTFTAGANSGLV